MKTTKYLILVSLTITLLNGCNREGAKTANYKPIANGFSYSSEWIGVDQGPTSALVYRSDNGKNILVWKELSGNSPVLVKDKMAVFLGYRLSRKADEGRRISEVRLLAVREPGPVIDISEAALKFWAKNSNQDVEKFLSTYEVTWFDKEETGDGRNEIVVVYTGRYLDVNGAFTHIHLKWEQVEKWLDEIKTPAKEKE